MMQIRHEAAGFLLDDSLSSRPFLLAFAAIALAGGRQVVNRIKINTHELADRHIKVARDRQVENEQRALIPLGDYRTEIGRHHDRLA